MRHQYVTINYATHGIYVHLYYFFITEANDPKIFSAGNDTNATKHDLPEKYSTMLSEGENKICIDLSNRKIPPKDYDTQKFITRNHYPYVYEAIYSLISANLPNNLTHTIDLIDAPPTQLKVGDPLYTYFHRYKDYI